MTNTELIALLGEARDFMVDSCRECSRESTPLRVRIDAARKEPASKCVRCEELQEHLDEADEDLEIANTKLKEIVELVGEGGDGSAFGSVESMLATFDYRQKLLLKQRDEARAEVKRLEAALAESPTSTKQVEEPKKPDALRKMVWKQVNSHHLCRLGPLSLIVDPPDEHSKKYMWTIMIGASGFIHGGFGVTLEDAKTASEKGVRQFVREVSALDIPPEST